MRRPLFAVCLAITCVIALCYWLSPPPLPDFVPAGTEEMLVYGRIERKENRISYGKEQFILYLTDYLVYSSDSVYSNDSSDSKKSDAALNFRQAKSIKREENQVICYTASTEWEPKTGSFVLMRGKPEDFPRATNQGEFDSRLYYATLGIDFCLKKAVIMWESNSYSFWKEGLWKLRCRWRERLEERLEEPSASVMKTMLLGDKEALDKEVKALYQDGGIAHILAISGLHISILGMGFYKVLRRVGIPIGAAAVLGAVFILTYGIMTGASVSTGRAVGMFLIRMLAEVLGRGYDMLNALGLLLLWMTLQQPLYVYNSGFLLSFLAVLGIGLLSPVLKRKSQPKKYRRGWEKRVYLLLETMKSNFISSLSVILTTMPVSFMFFYEMPVYGVILNLIVLPLVPAVMYLGMALLFLPEGVWLRIPTVVIEMILAVFEWVCEGSLYLPGQTFIRGKPKLWQVVVYVLLMAIIIRGRRGGEYCGVPVRGRIFLWGKWVLVGIAVSILCIKCPVESQITFLDVGQGDSICIRAGDGSAYLVDCGSSSKNNVGKYIVAPFLKSEGISYLEAVIITHPDADHCNGLTGLLEEGYAGRIGFLLLPEIPMESKTEEYLELERLAILYGIPLGYLSEGMVWDDIGMTFTCLNPGKAECGQDALGGNYESLDSNECSVVLHVECDTFSALLTGDVEGEGEEQLIEALTENGIDKVTVLKVAHHGSRYSTTEGFLDVLDAQVAVISCGEGNSYGHPHGELLERLKKESMVITSTPECGAVRIEIEGKKGIMMRTWRK